jgi:hypothetical protein
MMAFSDLYCSMLSLSVAAEMMMLMTTRKETMKVAGMLEAENSIDMDVEMEMYSNRLTTIVADQRVTFAKETDVEVPDENENLLMAIAMVGEMD